jgi:hypothetical protein
MPALHVFTALKLPSVASYVVEFTFQRGFDSFRAHHLFKHLAALPIELNNTIVSFLCPYWTRWLATKATSSMFWCWYFIVVLTDVCPMTFITANRFLVARYISVPKPWRAQ